MDEATLQRAPGTRVDRITIRRPDDWHVHFRDGEMMRAVAPFTARQFARAVVMPNLLPPVTTTAAARAYRERILDAVGRGAGFTPLMTAYLTDSSDPADLARGRDEGVLTAVKLYPAHATTNSAHGVTDIARVRPVLERLQQIGMPLLLLSRHSFDSAGTPVEWAQSRYRGDRYKLVTRLHRGGIRIPRPGE